MIILEYWKPLKHNEIVDEYYISTDAKFKTSIEKAYTNFYHSTNGYDFISLVIKELYYGKKLTRHFPVDDLVAQTFIPIPDELIGKPVKVEHIDGNLRNNHYENLRWVEDIEEWRDIPGFEGLYQVSDHGNCRSLRTGTVLKSGKCRTYRMFAFSINGKMYCYNAHILIMKSFYGEYDKDLQINHINEKGDDNRLKNLELISRFENNKFGSRNLKIGINHNGGRKRICVKCVETGEIYSEIAIAAREYNLSSTGLRNVLDNPNRTFAGLHWITYNDRDDNNEAIT